MDLVVIAAMASGAGAVIGWLAKHFSGNGKGNGSRSLLENAIETKVLVQSNTQILQEVSKMQVRLAEVIAEIERRSRNSDDAIKKILGS